MPRVDDTLIQSTVYLYASKEDAADGGPSGGTGFLVSLPLDPDNIGRRGWVYVVTNSHVVREGGATIVRMNVTGGKKAILETSPEAWAHHSDGDDVAVCQFGGTDPEILPDLQFMTISRGSILTRADVENPARNIGIGDDVFFVGRFSAHEGRKQNWPTVRFGTIAMMPWEPVTHPTRDINQDCYLVEARSLSGYSGSPVYLYYPLVGQTGAPNVIGGPEPSVVHPRYPQSSPWYLLGIDFGHLNQWERVVDAAGEKVEDYRVQRNSGMMMVVPSWKLLELLDQEELVEERARQASRRSDLEVPD